MTATTPYTVTTHTTEHYPHAIVFGNNERRFMFVGDVFPLTAKRKRAIVSHVVKARDLPLPPGDLAEVYNRNGFCKHENVTLKYQTITNNATGETREDVSDTHSHGGGITFAANFELVTL